MSELIEKDRIAQRLTFAFVSMGLDPVIAEHRETIGRMLRVDAQTITAWTVGERLPELWRIAEVGRHSGLSALWLLAGQGPIEAARVLEGLVLKTENDELIGVSSPVESDTAAGIVGLANEVNEALADGRIDNDLEAHINDVVWSLRRLIKAPRESG